MSSSDSPAEDFLRKPADRSFGLALQGEIERCRDLLYAKAVETPSLPRLTHLLLLDRTSASIAIPSGDCSVARLLTDDRSLTRLLGRPAMTRTKQGVAYFSNRDGGETHRDQVLCALALSGVPIDSPVYVGESQFTIHDLVTDSLANFHLKREEVAWAAISYAIYSPGLKKFTNKFGRSFAFDELVKALLARPLAEESCGGFHNISALTVILQSHNRVSLISETVATEVKSFLNKCVGAVVATQFSDGSWDSSWLQSLSDGGSSNSLIASVSQSDKTAGLLVTGHLLEWIYLHQSSMALPADVEPKACEYLLGRLRTLTIEEIQDHFCPITHSLIAMRCYGGNADAVP